MGDELALDVLPVLADDVQQTRDDVRGLRVLQVQRLEPVPDRLPRQLLLALLQLLQTRLQHLRALLVLHLPQHFVRELRELVVSLGHCLLHLIIILCGGLDLLEDLGKRAG